MYCCAFLQQTQRKSITSNISAFIKSQNKLNYKNNAFNGKTARIWTSALIGEINTHIKSTTELIKAYDTLSLLDRYLDETAILINENNYHNTLSKKILH